MTQRPYLQLLRKMFALEIIGEKLYRALAEKVKDEKLKLIYQRLALNESQTGTCIERELEKLYGNRRVPHRAFISNIAGSLFCLFPASILVKILENTLKKRIYSQWYQSNHSAHEEFWVILLRHEEVQRELLNLSGESIKGGGK